MWVLPREFLESQMFIARHDHGWEPDILSEQLDYAAEDLQDALVKVDKKPNNIYSLLKSSIDYAGYLSVLEPNSSQLKRSLTIAAKTTRCIFSLADPSITIEYDLDVGEGPVFSFPQTGPTSYSDSTVWQKGFYLAAACREKYVLDDLTSISTEVMRQSSAIVNECEHLMVDALKSLYDIETPVAETLKKLTDALKATDPDKIPEMTIDATLNITVPEIELIIRFLEGDAQAFNASLAKALECHKKLWSSNEQMAGDPRGFIVIGPLGIACYAYDAGFPIEVESEYIPKYILEKQYLAKQQAS
jgi:hypothetical protein